MRRFYLHKRGSVYYAELINQETGIKMTAKSTGTRTQDDALLVVAEWLRTGIPQGHAKEKREKGTVFNLEGILGGIKHLDLIAADAEKIAAILKDRGFLVSYTVAGGPGSQMVAGFLESFWTYETSPYIREKAAYKQSMTRGHCTLSLGRIKTYWEPYFRGKRLGDLTRNDIKEFSLALPSKGLSTLTMNHVLACGKTPLRWAYENGLIAEDVTKGISTYGGQGKKRGILESEEAERLFAEASWNDPRAKLAAMVALTCGLRQGEILVLRPADIGEDVLTVARNWSDSDGEKCTKTGETRKVPVLPALRDELRRQGKENPYDPVNGFIFYGIDASRPMRAQSVLYAFKDALESIGVDHAGRNILFHSLRHTYATALSERVTEAQAMKSTGHKTSAMFAHYSDHQTEEGLEAVGKASEAAFGNIVSFRKAASE